MGFKKQIKAEIGRTVKAVDIPEITVRKLLGDGVTDKMKLGYDVGKKNETPYAKYTYIKDDPLAAWPR